MPKHKNRLLCSLLAVLLLFAVGCENHAEPADLSAYTHISSFKTIPGITEEEIQAIERYIDAGQAFQCAVMLGSECFYDENGELQGFSKLVYDWLSDVFSIPFEPVVVQWNELLDGLESCEFDFSVDIPTSWKDDGEYYVTDAIIERGMRLFLSNPADTATGDRKNDMTPRYGYLDSRDKADTLSVYLNKKCTLIPVPSFDAAQEMMISGALEGFIGGDTADTVITAYSSIEMIPGLSHSTVSLATCNPQLAPVISALQKYLLAGGGSILNELQEIGTYQCIRVRLQKQLTTQEKSYIAAHQSEATEIPIAVSFDNYPYSFFNTREGEWQGIAIDILGKIQTITGLHFTIVNETDTNWPTLKDMLKSGEAVMTTELIRTPERAVDFIWTEEPYLTDYYALLSMSEYPDVNVSQVPNARVGLIQDTAYADTFLEMYPNHSNLVYFENKFSAFTALEKGEVDLLMMTRNLLLDATNYLEKSGYKANLTFDRLYESYYGFNKSEALLCSVISKTQQLVNVNHISDSWTRRVFDYRGKLAQVQVLYLASTSAVLLITLVFLAILLVKNRKMGTKLAATVQVRTQELQERTIISYTDKLTNIYNRFKFDEELAEWCENDIEFCVFLLDIDHFKKVNDTFGHLAGDKVLVELAEVISGSIRENDTFARWGGEEFALLLRGVAPDTAIELARRLLKTVESKEIAGIGHITVSIGVVSRDAVDTPEAIMQRADKAMYHSKENGRNTVTFL